MQFRVEIFGDMGWTGEVLIFFLSQPSECVGNVQPQAGTITPVLTATVQDAAAVKKNRSRAHLSLYDLIRIGTALPIPMITSWHASRGTIFASEVGQGPDGVELWFDGLGNVIAPGETIPV